jgi:uncharacterized protein
MIAVLLILAIYVGIVAIVYVSQRRLMYFPTHGTPTSRLSPWLVGGEIVGYARESTAPARVWLMMHGNGGQAAHRDYILSCVGSGDAVFVLEYPGYGVRPGMPSRASIDEAALLAYRELRARYPQASIGVIGESLGSGPASQLAKASPTPDRIVLITPFDTLVNVAAGAYPYLPVRYLLRDRWDNITALRGYHGRLEIFGAANDGVIPIKHARALADALGVPLKTLRAGHNDWMNRGLVKLE